MINYIMTSRLNSQQNSLTFGNTNTHIFTEFSTLNKESTQQEVLQAIKDINISAEIGEITVESSDTVTHERLTNTNAKLDTLHADLTSIDGKIDGILTTDASNNLLVYSSNIASTPLISGFSLEETQQQIKVKTDDLTFSDNGGVIELRVFDSQNNISLNTINDTITNKHLDSATDSVTVTGSISIDTTGLALETTLQSIDGKINNDGTLTDAIQVAIKNNILVVDPINNSINEAPYDLIINGPAVYADSLPAGNPFFADANGREGWYYDNQSNILNRSNIYWYANPTTGIFQENDMTFSQLNNMYSIITCDYVDDGSLTIPTLGIYSQPTGVNDFIPTFAHSRWVYQLSSGNRAKLRKGETILIYTGATRPTVHINLPSYPLNLVSQNGDALSTEIIAYMTVNTQATTSKIGYLLQYAGYLNSAVGFNREYSFLNSQERLSQLNLSSLTFEDGELIIYSGPITTAIANKHLEFGFDKVDVGGSSVSVSNFPENQVVSGTVAFSNSSIEVSGTVAFSNTSIQVSSMPNLNANTDSVTIVPNGDALPVSGTFFQATQPISGSVSVSNLPATQPVSGTVAISNTSIPVTGTFFQTTQPISGSVSVSNLPATQPISGSVSVSNFPATQPISGSISNSFTLDTTTQSSNTKLDTIHNDLDGLTFDGSSNLNVNVVSGSITVSSVSVSNFPATQPVSGTVAISNTSVDTHCYASSNGTNWHHLSSDANGQLNVHSKTQSGAGTDITSTTAGAVIGLDTASDLYAFDGTTRRRVLCDTSSRLFSVSNIRDGSGNPITSTTTTATTQSLDTASSLYVSDGTIRTALSSTGGSLNANITNNLTVSNAFALDSTLISTNSKIDTTNSTLTTTNTKLDTGNGYLNTINNATGDFTDTFTFGNFINNESISGGSDSTTDTFTRGSLKRNVIAIYRDSSTVNTDSISFYTVSTAGSPNNLLLATVYPITVGGFRQVTINLNLLSFNSLFIKNDSASTINNVYLTVLNG